MSIAEAIARVDQISALVASVAPEAVASTAAPASSQAFARSLATASAATAAPKAASTAAPTGLATAASATANLPLSGEGAIPASLEPLVRRAAAGTGLDPALVAAVARAESGFRVDAGSRAGARGLMQLMPSTAAGLGVNNILDPAQNLGAGSRYLKQQIDRFGDLRLALAAYNAGPGAVSRYGGVPPYAETQAYVTKVLGYYDQYRGTAAAAL